MWTNLPRPLPFDQWPRLHQVAWSHAINTDPLAPGGGGGGGEKWRPTTRAAVEKAYGYWLGWLSHEDELHACDLPMAHATPDHVRRYLTALEAAGLADYSRAWRISGLSSALRVMAPENDVRFIGRAGARISATAQRKNDLTSRLRPPAEIRDFGLRLMARGETEKGLVPTQRALLFRDGLLIALWVNRPLRIANLGSIEVGRNLVKTPRGFRLVFQKGEMKSGRPFECDWPRNLNSALLRYLEEHRLILLSLGRSHPEATALWISQFGGPMKVASVGQAIRLRTQTEFGKAIGPHLMRHIVATAVAEQNPNQVADVAAILGHASIETAEHHYIMAGSMRAAEVFQAAILERSADGSRRRRGRECAA